MIEAYPLYWPEGQARVPRSRRRTAQFTLAFARARDELVAELGRMGARGVIVSTNIPLRRDGLPYADFRAPEDPAVAVYFTHGKRQLVIACDSYTRVEWNMRACGATVGALRTIQRHGATELLERAFTGFTALPPKGGEDHPWWDVLGVPREASDDLPWWWMVTFVVAGLAVAFVGCVDMWKLNRRPQVIHHRLEELYTVHRCPPTGSGLMPCCGRTPFEVPLTDKMTEDPRLVTCRLQ